MKVYELIEKLKTLPQDYHVTMADFQLVTFVEVVNCGDGCVVISDYTEDCEE